MVLRRRRHIAAVVAFVATLCISVLSMNAASAAQPTVSTAVRVTLPATAPATKPLVLAAKNAVSGDCAAIRADELRAAARGVHQEALCSTYAKSAALPPSAALSANAVTPAVYWCTKDGADIWVITRHEECITGVVDTVEAFLNGNVVGIADFTISQNIMLSATSGIFTEDDTIQFTAGVGVLDVPTTVTFDAACTSSSCATLLGSGFAAIAPAESVHFHDAYEDTPSGQDPTQTEYTMAVAPPPTYPPAEPVSWGSAATIRCDNQLANLPTGCVLPQYTPALHLSAAVEGAGAVNVAVGEKYVAGTPGASTSTPLTRLIDPTLQAQYGAAMCGGKTFMPILEITDDSCDEYPFKSTQQSGGAFGLTGPACAQAIPYQQGGAWYVDFIGNYNPATQYQCLIGHVPLAQNKLVGSHLAAFYSLNRVLNGDAYTIYVTN